MLLSQLRSQFLSSSLNMFAAIGMRIHSHRTFEQPVAKSRNYRNLWLFRYRRAATIVICGVFRRRDAEPIVFCGVCAVPAIEEPKLSCFARFCGPGRTLERENTWFCGPERTLERENTWFRGSGRKVEK